MLIKQPFEMVTVPVAFAAPALASITAATRYRKRCPGIAIPFKSDRPKKKGTGGLCQATPMPSSWEKRYSPWTLVTASITRSRLKEPGFWRGGNSLKLCSHLAT